MALLGRKNFTTGAVFTEGDADGLMLQTIMTFATSAARTTAMDGDEEEGMWSQTLDDDNLSRHNGTAWVVQQSPWVDYTPAWTNLTVGNGVTVAKARYVGGDLRIRGKFTWGTTTSASGTIYQSIPYALTADSAGGSGVGVYKDVSGSRTYPCALDIAGSDTAINWFHAETGGVLTDVSPVTMADTDIIRWDITVPVA